MTLKELKEELSQPKVGKEAIIGLDQYNSGNESNFLLLKFVKFVDSADGINGLVQFKERNNYIYNLNYKDVSKVKKILYLKRGTFRKISTVYKDKTPKNKLNHVGVEIELVSKLNDTEMNLMIADAGLEKNVQVKDDGSINTEEGFRNSHELCILGDEKTIFKIITQLAKLLKGNSKVNKSCGLHVHLDMRNRDVSRAYANLYAKQPLLYSMCPKTRFSNSYCQPASEYEAFDEDDSNGRYWGINKASYADHNTLEIRMHSATLNADKINNWVKLLLRIVDMGRLDWELDVKLQNNYKQIKRELKIRGKLDKYIQSRLKIYANGINDPKFKVAA